MYAMNEVIPTKYVDPRRSPHWITPTILHQIRKKVTARGTDYLKQTFTKLRTEVKKAIEKKQRGVFLVFRQHLKS